MRGFGGKLCYLVEVLFGLTAMQGADASGGVALFNNRDVESFNSKFRGRGLTSGSRTDYDNIISVHEKAPLEKD
jgi:hypothetical protein